MKDHTAFSRALAAYNFLLKLSRSAAKRPSTMSVQQKISQRCDEVAPKFVVLLGLGNMQTIFFDLDGTLSDNREGITRCLQHAFRELGLMEPAKEIIETRIGPPLRQTFALFLGEQKNHLLEHALNVYRQRFSEIGLYENILYPGIPELLEKLTQDNRRLFVVTSKVRIYAERIIDHFGLSSCFEQIYGAELDGRFEQKTELLLHVLQTNKIIPDESVMIGDRKHDIEAARANGVKTIGVTYGFAAPGEFEQFPPDFVCSSPAEICEIIHASSVHK